jgi:hypothetical protein
MSRKRSASGRARRGRWSGLRRFSRARSSGACGQQGLGSPGRRGQRPRIGAELEAAEQLDVEHARHGVSTRRSWHTARRQALNETGDYERGPSVDHRLFTTACNNGRASSVTFVAWAPSSVAPDAIDVT